MLLSFEARSTSRPNVHALPSPRAAIAGFDLIVESRQKRGAIRDLLLPAEAVGRGEVLDGKDEDLLPSHPLERTQHDRRGPRLGGLRRARGTKRHESSKKKGSHQVMLLDCGKVNAYSISSHS